MLYLYLDQARYDIFHGIESNLTKPESRVAHTGCKVISAQVAVEYKFIRRVANRERRQVTSR